MSAIERFANRIRQIKGVAEFALVRNDGHTMVHNLREPGEFTSLVTLFGLNAHSIGKSIGFSQYHYLIANRHAAGSLLIFPLDKYFLGIAQRQDANQAAMIAEIQAVLAQVVSQKKSAGATAQEG